MVNFAKILENIHAATDCGRAWVIDRSNECAIVVTYPFDKEHQSFGRYRLMGPAVTGTREEAILLGIDSEKYVIHWRTKIDPRDLV